MEKISEPSLGSGRDSTKLLAGGGRDSQSYCRWDKLRDPFRNAKDLAILVQVVGHALPTPAIDRVSARGPPKSGHRSSRVRDMSSESGLREEHADVWSVA